MTIREQQTEENASLSLELIFQELDEATRLWAPLAQAATHPTLAEAIGHAFSALAHMRTYTQCLRRAQKQQQGKQWKQAIEQYDRTITFLGFADHDWGYATNMLHSLFTRQSQQTQAAKTRFSIRSAFSRVFCRERCKPIPACLYDADEDEDECATIPLNEELHAACMQALFTAIEERRRIFHICLFCLDQQIACFRQHTQVK